MEHISHSQLTTFTDCNLKWKLSREQLAIQGQDDEGGTWAQKAGSVIHTVMELYHSPQYKQRNPDDIPTFFEHAMEETPLKAPYEGQVTASLNHFIDTFGLDPKHNPDFVELAFEVPLIKGFTLAGIFDDISFDHVNKELVIGEYKSSLKPIDAQEKVWQTYQPFVYQYAASIMYPDYRHKAMRYTLLDPKGVQRVERPMYPESLPEWTAYLKRQAKQMLAVKEGKEIAFPNYSWKCNGGIGCAFWDGVCQRKLMIGV